jgi:hypothetical protein
MTHFLEQAGFVTLFVLAFLLGRISMSWQIGRSFILMPKDQAHKLYRIDAKRRNGA